MKLRVNAAATIKKILSVFKERSTMLKKHPDLISTID
jgi:hypothetical protein